MITAHRSGNTLGTDIRTTHVGIHRVLLRALRAMIVTRSILPGHHAGPLTAMHSALPWIVGVRLNAHPSGGANSSL
jgi:hypothetical protein